MTTILLLSVYLWDCFHHSITFCLSLRLCPSFYLLSVHLWDCFHQSITFCLSLKLFPSFYYFLFIFETVSIILLLSVYLWDCVHHSIKLVVLSAYLWYFVHHFLARGSYTGLIYVPFFVRFRTRVTGRRSAHCYSTVWTTPHRHLVLHLKEHTLINRDGR